MSRHAGRDADAEGRKVFLGGLPFEAKEDDIRQDFAKFGDIEDVHLPQDGTGRHKGFAFVTFSDARDASDAAKDKHGLPYMGREISVRVVEPRDRRPPGGGGGGGGGGGRDRDRDYDRRDRDYDRGRDRDRDYDRRDDRGRGRSYDRDYDRDRDRGRRSYDRDRSPDRGRDRDDDRDRDRGRDRSD